jgi:NAD(P)-dependent dehydrogenase (short-subunit alcohol dehydrogenase family)
MIQAVLPRMRERRAGTIVNLSSIAGLVTRPYGGFYAVSKHAVEAITEALRYEVTPFGIRVLLIEPGQYGTRLLENAYPGTTLHARVTLLGSLGALRRAHQAPRAGRRARGSGRSRAADLRGRARGTPAVPDSRRR